MRQKFQRLARSTRDFFSVPWEPKPEPPPGTPSPTLSPQTPKPAPGLAVCDVMGPQPFFTTVACEQQRDATPCSGHGNCSAGLNGSGTCICYASAADGYFRGTACSDCVAGYYGASCTQVSPPVSVCNEDCSFLIILIILILIIFFSMFGLLFLQAFPLNFFSHFWQHFTRLFPRVFSDFCRKMFCSGRLFVSTAPPPQRVRVPLAALPQACPGGAAQPCSGRGQCSDGVHPCCLGREALWTSMPAVCGSGACDSWVPSGVCAVSAAGRPLSAFRHPVLSCSFRWTL